MSKIEVNQISSQCGSTLTIGQSGDTVTLACGATQTGFGRTGTVDWDTTAKTTNFTAVSGNGYFVNTTSGAITVTLPAGSAGDIVSLADYAATWQTNNATVTPNGTDKIGGENVSVFLNTEGQSVTFVYVDSTQGWLNTMDSTSNVRGNAYIVATGGTITTCGDYKIHTFTGPDTFCVSCAGIPANSNVDYLVVAGGGGGGSSNPGSTNSKGGAGAGGLRFSAGTYCAPAPASPLAATSLPVTATAYPITVGGGGSVTPCNVNGSPGNNSIFSTITSAGGGQGGAGGGPCTGSSGGSGGANSSTGIVANAGNTPPVSPPQGNPSGIPGGSAGNAGGGGGASAAGTNGDYSPSPGNSSGGAGLDINITGSPVTRAGGGGGGGGHSGSGWVGTGGAGGGGAGAANCTGTPGGAGTANTGGGGGGAGSQSGGAGGVGGSGIVIIRYKYQ